MPNLFENTNLRTVLSDPSKKRALAIQLVQVLHLKIKTRNIEAAEEWKVICPLHQEKTPTGSMHISPEKFIYHCFSCQASGSLATLYFQLTGRSFYKDYNISSDEFSSFSFTPSYVEPDYSTIDKDIHIEVSGEVLPVEKSSEAIRYLRKRGITFEVANKMNMGFLKQGNINGTMFRNRLTIPIIENSKVLSIEGRDVTGLQTPKVLYPKDSTVQTLFDIDILDKSEPLYVVEGLMDLAVLRTDTYFKNSTALFGAGINERQLWLLNQFDKVIIIPDKDEAGSRSVRRLKEHLKREFFILEVPNLGIKDVGDIPQKLRTTVMNIRNRGWGRSLKSSLSLIFY